MFFELMVPNFFQIHNKTLYDYKLFCSDTVFTNDCDTSNRVNFLGSVFTTFEGSNIFFGNLKTSFLLKWQDLPLGQVTISQQFFFNFIQNLILRLGLNENYFLKGQKV